MKVCIFGAGMMGAGIAQVFLTAGHEVVLIDVQQPFVDSGELRIYKGLDYLEEKGKITPEFVKDCRKRLITSTDKDLAAEADFVMEVIKEDMKLKKSLLKELDNICPDRTIFASNTSAMSITEMAASIPHRSDKFVGCHFFNPAPVMKLVEVVRAIQTSDETFDFAFELMKAIGKTPIKVDEGPGFVVNRMLIPMMNEAIGIYADGLASAHDIDRAMQLGAGMRSGPLHTADLVGHDVNLAIMETIHNETGDPRYRPHPLLRKMVRAGWLGIKTGRGFFRYDKNGKEIPEAEPVKDEAK